ncbi:MAG: helix-turn-helix transcriptional regulator [Hyphomicrobiales bacterium]|nr:MAG: helix-turn-helix transcriptional regulator [Hyphomicrobiales bacterium]
MARIDEIVGTIQQAAEDDDAWPLMLTHLANYLGGVEATLGGGSAGSPPKMLAPRTDPAEVQRYFSTYHSHNLLMRDMAIFAPGQIVIDESLAPYEAFQRDVFYNEWCVPQSYNHAFGTNLVTSSGWRGTLMVNTSSVIDPEQIERLEAVLPALARTLEINKLFAQFRGLARASLDVLEISGQGAMLLDSRGMLLDCNAAAAALLDSGRLRLRFGRLGSDDAKSDAHLSRLIALCLQAPDHTSGGRVQVGTTQGPLSVQCAPYPGGLIFPASRRPAVIVIIADPQRKLRQRLEAVQRRFGLTTAEAELALALVETGSRKAAAAGRGVSDATARAQLTSIFDKTGVRRQTDLVRLLMEEI